MVQEIGADRPRGRVETRRLGTQDVLDDQSRHKDKTADAGIATGAEDCRCSCSGFCCCSCCNGHPRPPYLE